MTRCDAQRASRFSPNKHQTMLSAVDSPQLAPLSRTWAPPARWRRQVPERSQVAGVAGRQPNVWDPPSLTAPKDMGFTNPCLPSVGIRTGLSPRRRIGVPSCALLAVAFTSRVAAACASSLGVLLGYARSSNSKSAKGRRRLESSGGNRETLKVSRCQHVVAQWM